MIFGKMMAPILLVKSPVLFICVGLEPEESKWNKYLQEKITAQDRFIGCEQLLV